MVQDFNKRSKEVGTKIDACKTKVLQSFSLPKAKLWMGCVDLEEINVYVYLVQEVNMHHNLQSEIARRRGAVCGKFYSIIVVLTESNPVNRARFSIH